MTIYDRLKELRKTHLKMTQAEFAKILGLQASSYSMIENGHRAIKDSHLKILNVTYSVIIDWLKTGEGEVFEQDTAKKELLSLFQQLDPKGRQYILATARSFADMNEEE